MASSGAGLACFFLILLTAVPSLATDYTVGGSSGWALSVDYSTWASDMTLKVGDNLVFNYGSGHTVDEVSSSDYSSCTVGNSITTDSSGATTIPLKTAGTHYFICGIIGHCGGGMKLAVTVAAGEAAPAESTPPTGTGGATSLPPPVTSSGGKTSSGRFPDSSTSASLSPFVAAFFCTCVALVYKLIVS